MKVERSPGLTVLTIKPAPLTREQMIQKRTGLQQEKSRLRDQVAELDLQIKEIDEWLADNPE